MIASGRGRVVMPDPWVWEGWMIAGLRDAGYDVTLGSAADDHGATPLSPDEMAALLESADGVILHSRESILKSALEGASRLIIISKMGIGVDRIDVGAATERGIVVTNTPVLDDFRGIAEGTMTLMLALLKQLPQKHQTVRSGRWRDRTTTGDPLHERTVGLVGLGRVGGMVATLLGPWGVTLLGHDPNVTQIRAAELGVRLVELDELLTLSDIVSLHAVVTPENRQMFNARTFGLMKPGSYLINTARGALIDEEALVEALASGHLAGAALDVFQTEPLPAGHPLIECENVILTPHAIGTSRQSQRAICETALKNCLDALDGKWPTYPVNPEVASRWRGLRSPAGRD